MITIKPIVEGHGEIEAVPVLLRKFAALANANEVRILRPIRLHRSDFTNEEKIKKAFELAALSNCNAIFVLFDADHDCPKEIKPKISGWAEEVVSHIPCEVVMPNKEYEAWFLAAASSLRGKRGIRADAVFSLNPEDVLDAKGQLEDMMYPGKSYIATTDQPALTQVFDMKSAYSQCRSFRRVSSAFGSILSKTNAQHYNWPPADWA